MFLARHPRNEVVGEERDSGLEHVAEVESKKLLDVDDEGKCVNATRIVPLDVPLEVLGSRSQPPQQHHRGHAVFASAKRGVSGFGSRVPREGATSSLGVREKGVEGWGRSERGEEEPAGIPIRRNGRAREGGAWEGKGRV